MRTIVTILLLMVAWPVIGDNGWYLWFNTTRGMTVLSVQVHETSEYMQQDETFTYQSPQVNDGGIAIGPVSVFPGTNTATAIMNFVNDSGYPGYSTFSTNFIGNGFQIFANDARSTLTYGIKHYLSDYTWTMVTATNGQLFPFDSDQQFFDLRTNGVMLRRFVGSLHDTNCYDSNGEICQCPTNDMVVNLNNVNLMPR